MTWKRHALLILCLVIVLTSFGCFTPVSKVVQIEPFAGTDVHIQEDITFDEYDDQSIYEAGGVERRRGNQSEHIQIAYRLDKSSAEAFAADMKVTYGIILRDRYNHLTGPHAKWMMLELDHALSLFSPEFIVTLVSRYAKHGATFSLELGDHNDYQYGRTVWSSDLTIVLYHDHNPARSGITAAVLAHELAHAAHFIIEGQIGEAHLERDMTSFNGSHQYVGDLYDEKWRQDIHGFYFAYDYSMYDYYEDIATVMEWLVFAPDEMTERLSDYRHEALFRKTMYIRDIMYYYISDACSALFLPFYEAEAYWADAVA